MAFAMGPVASGPMFVQLLPREGPARQEFVLPPPGLSLPVPCDVPATVPGLARVGGAALAAPRDEGAADGPAPPAAAAPLKLDAALAFGSAPPLAAGKSEGPAAGSPAAGPVPQDPSPLAPVLDVLEDDAEAEALLKPVLNDVIGRSRAGKPSPAGAGSGARWWARPDLPLLCPLTRFPICLLPYPPFKLRIDPKRSSPHRLVDGKFLAMHVIVTGAYFACGRELEASDLKALDEYVHRCKLGPYRPGRAALLAKEAVLAETPEERQQAAQDHERFVAAARAELGKLRRIQENRLLQVSKVLPSALPMHGAAPRPQPERSRFSSSAASTASTAASSGGE